MTNPRMVSPRKLDDVQVREAHRRYTQDRRSLRELAGLYGISHVQLAKAFHRLSLPVRAPGMRTPPELVRKVQDLRAQGLTWNQVAAATGLSVRGARYIIQKAGPN